MSASDCFWPEDPLPLPGVDVGPDVVSAGGKGGATKRDAVTPGQRHQVGVPQGRVRAMMALTQMLANPTNACRCKRGRRCLPCQATLIITTWPCQPVRARVAIPRRRRAVTTAERKR